MNRRRFIQASMALQSFAVVVPTTVDSLASRAKIQFHPCLNQATTLNADFESECKAYTAAGFERIELWFDKLSRLNLSNARILEMLRDSGLQPVSACGIDDLLWPARGKLSARVPELKTTLERAQALNVPRLVVSDDVSESVALDDYKVAAERLAKIADMASDHNVSIALEFCANSKFIGSLATALSVLRSAKHHNAGLCLDTFHFFTGVSKFEDLNDIRENEVTHVHFHDVPRVPPREMLQDEDRVLPGEGVIPLRTITDALARIGYSGSLSVELFNPRYQSGVALEIAHQCYQSVLPYLRDSPELRPG